MGKLNTVANATGDPQIVQEIPGVATGTSGATPGNTTGIPGGNNRTGIYVSPSYYNGAIFIAAVADDLRKIPITNGLLDWASMTSTGNEIVQRGATTSISANGSSNGIIWYLDASAYTYQWISGEFPPTLTFGPPILYAYSTDDLSAPLYSSKTVAADAAGCPTSAANTPGSGSGCAVKFAVPTVIAGKVFVGTDTEISVYGLRSDVAAANFQPQANRGIASVRAAGFDFSPAGFKVENSCPPHTSGLATGALF